MYEEIELDSVEITNGNIGEFTIPFSSETATLLQNQKMISEINFRCCNLEIHHQALEPFKNLAVGCKAICTLDTTDPEKIRECSNAATNIILCSITVGPVIGPSIYAGKRIYESFKGSAFKGGLKTLTDIGIGAACWFASDGIAEIIAQGTSTVLPVWFTKPFVQTWSSTVAVAVKEFATDLIKCKRVVANNSNTLFAVSNPINGIRENQFDNRMRV